MISLTRITSVVTTFIFKTAVVPIHTWLLFRRTKNLLKRKVVVQCFEAGAGCWPSLARRWWTLLLFIGVFHPSLNGDLVGAVLVDFFYSSLSSCSLIYARPGIVFSCARAWFVRTVQSFARTSKCRRFCNKRSNRHCLKLQTTSTWKAETCTLSDFRTNASRLDSLVRCDKDLPTELCPLSRSSPCEESTPHDVQHSTNVWPVDASV